MCGEPLKFQQGQVSIRWMMSLVIAVSVTGLLLGVSLAVASEVDTRGMNTELSVSVVGSFSDIAEAGGHRANVKTLAEEGILDGTECSPGKFCPNEPIQRWVMAVWLVRAVDETEPDAVGSSRFGDVDADEWWVPYVERLADLGITRGCSTEPVLFCPTEPVTRQEMASFLVRAFGLEPVSGNKFADVFEGPHLADINALFAAKVTAGCATEPVLYCPTRDTTRAEMATFLARTLGVDRVPQPEDSATSSNEETNRVPTGPFGMFHFNEPGTQPDPEMCRPPGLNSITAGFPLPSFSIPSIGKIRVVVLFVDFHDAQATHSTHREAELGLTYMENYLESASEGKVDIEFTTLHRWLRAEHNSSHYRPNLFEDISQELVELVDPEIDFAQQQVLMVVLPSEHFLGGNAGLPVQTDEGAIQTIRINQFGSIPPIVDPVPWGDVGAHELLHLFGLLDQYPHLEGFEHKRPANSEEKVWILSIFGRMGLQGYYPTFHFDPRTAIELTSPDGHQSTHYSGFTAASEMLAWSRWQLGWLDRIHCVTQLETETTITIRPAGLPGTEGAMIAIPLSDTQVIVIESRRNCGFDTGLDRPRLDGTQVTYPGLATEGVFVYTVDASIGSGQLPLKIAGDSGDGILDDYPILTAGQSVTLHGYTITVHSSTADTDTVTITKIGDQ